MATVKAHYESVLSDVYSWMFGGMEQGLSRNRALFKELGLEPVSQGLAIDLGAGCGFQSIPLAELGYQVMAIDLDDKLLQEMSAHADGLNIEPVQGNLCDFPAFLANTYPEKKSDLIICMTDTLLHLDSAEQVKQVISDVRNHLSQKGKFVLSFRDLSFELLELARFIPVKSDENTVFTCFLEYEKEKVKVHDLVNKRVNDEWHFYKSFYYKLRLSEQWIKQVLQECGLTLIAEKNQNGMLVIVAELSV